MLIQCPSCQKALSLPDDAGGKQVRCPLCSAIFLIAAPPPPPVPSVQVAPLPMPPMQLPPAHVPSLEVPAGPIAVLPPEPLPPQPSRRGPERDFGFDDGADSDRRGVDLIRQKALLASGAGWLTGAATYFLLYVVLSIMSTACVLGGLPMRGQSGAYVFGMFIGMLLFCIPSIFMFVGASQMRQARSRGLIITGVVFDFIMCALLLLGLVCNLANMFHGPNPYVAIAFIQILLAGGGIALGITAGVKTLVLINRRDMQPIFGGRADDRWDEEDETDWEKRRRRRRGRDDY